MGLSPSLLLSAWDEILRHNWYGSATTIENVLASSLSFDRDTGGLTSETYKKVDRNLQAHQAPNKMAAKSTLKPLGTAQMNIPALNLPDPFVMFSPRPASELDAAATKVQKVYKSYRTRRNLADCAVLVEELWWKALDSAALKQCSVSFFNVQKHESALSRWARARTRAAKVGKGLSKDEKAQKLALQHWLEAIDPRHRYGHNLHFYYDVWSETKSSQPFFYWLDIGDGKEVDLKKCPKVDLQRQCIKYLGPKEREGFEVIVECGKLVYKQTGMSVETSEGCKWIFVLSTTRSLYVGKKKKGVFQHSSFLSGGAISSAGRLVAHEGVLEAIWPYSGHYLPTEDNFKEFISFLEEHNVELTNVKRCAVDDDNPSLTSSSSSIELREENDKEQSTMETSAHIRASNISTSVTGTDKCTGTGTGTGTTRSQQAHTGVPDVRPAPLLTLAKRLSGKWTSGVSPRIGCIRDYPTELQSQALEHVNLSPRHTPSRIAAHCPIPSPRPSPKIRVSPRLAYMGLTSPRVVHG